jgi:hypothetical protein
LSSTSSHQFFEALEALEAGSALDYFSSIQSIASQKMANNLRGKKTYNGKEKYYPRRTTLPWYT